jgi:hypothetical protein
MAVPLGMGCLVIGWLREMPFFSALSLVRLWPFVGAARAFVRDVKKDTDAIRRAAAAFKVA